MAARPSVRELPTPLGPARLHTSAPSGAPAGTLVLGHGAGGGVGSADLTAVASAACGAGWLVHLVEQPWRVAGRRLAPAPPRLDEAWTAALTAVLGVTDRSGPLVLGGRSAGARVACRTAATLGADGVVALAFPLHPPGRPEKSRAAELAVPVPLLVVQGERDAFGRPAEFDGTLPAGAQLQAVPGDHALTRDPHAVAAAVVDWLRGLPGPRRPAAASRIGVTAPGSPPTVSQAP